jgi:alkanesulfonate monooxygenase SsuD/methylene tetrahydromethanopterin reductase-like flavin-dependent oxidoreductase (luciferase family)
VPTPEEAADYPWTPAEREFVAQRRAGQAVGSPDTVRAALAQLLEATRPNELMITSQLHSPEDRIRSTELVRELFGDLPLGLQQT